jgi:beta-galactosidase
MASCATRFLLFVFLFVSLPGYAQVRDRISFNNDWRFYKYSSAEEADGLIYDVRPAINGYDDSINADAKPTDAVKITPRSKYSSPG